MGKPQLRILIVEDSAHDLELLRILVASSENESISARTVSAARKLLSEDHEIDLVVSDMRLPDGTGVEFLDDAPLGLPVILVTAYGEIEEAVGAMQRGALHYLTKPIREDEFRLLVDRAAASIETHRELERLREAGASRLVEPEVVARSAAMHGILDTARAAAASDATVLLLGESGTGKEVFARMIHRLSSRSDGPFVPVHCGAIPATLLEAELFGHEKGAFTGALGRRIGKFERAHRGTLFLDLLTFMLLDSAA